MAEKNTGREGALETARGVDVSGADAGIGVGAGTADGVAVATVGGSTVGSLQWAAMEKSDCCFERGGLFLQPCGHRGALRQLGQTTKFDNIFHVGKRQNNLFYCIN
jgi:hypothetical protein